MVACGSEHLDVKIRWFDTQQTIDGFGASSAFFGETITNDVADQLFDAKKGIGLSLLRTIIGLPDDILQDGSEPADGTANPIASAPGVVTALQATLREPRSGRRPGRRRPSGRRPTTRTAPARATPRTSSTPRTIRTTRTTWRTSST